jgi:cytochrome c oxidase assembly factor CtaG
MHFMFLILAFMLWAVVWGFFHSNPRGVPPGALLACNVAIIALGVAAALTSAVPLYFDALATKPDHAATAVYLAVLAGGAAFMIVLAAGGLARNLVVFPLSKRSPT